MNKQRIRKAVFPAAGLGTRFLPATKSQPKEMLPIIDKPVIQYLVEEAVASGIEEIIIVTGRGKRAIEDHFDRSVELEQFLIERGRADLLTEVRRIADLVKIVYVRQPSPRGDGDAILCARSVVGDEPFAVMFGDDLVDGETPALRQLISVFYEKHAPVVAIQQVPWDRVSNYGIVNPRQRDGRVFQLQDLVEKPPREQAPSNYAVIGKYIVTPELLDALERARALSDGAELKLIDGFREYVRMSPVYGCELSGRRYDTGNKLDFLKATVDFALKRPDLGEAFKKYLVGLDLQGRLGYNYLIPKTKTNNTHANGNTIQQFSNGGRVADERIRPIAPGGGREEIEWPARGGYRDLREDSPYGP